LVDGYSPGAHSPYADQRFVLGGPVQGRGNPENPRASSNSKLDGRTGKFQEKRHAWGGQRGKLGRRGSGSEVLSKRSVKQAPQENRGPLKRRGGGEG